MKKRYVVAKIGLTFLICMVLIATASAQQDRLQQRFEQLDGDHDGKLSAQEAPWNRWFERADADDDGFVTLQEARAALSERPETEQAGDRLGTVPEGVTNKTVAYAQMEGVDPERLSLDLYAPDDAQDAPVMLFVHGGGWARGDRSAVWYKPEFFCKSGWVFASTNYRFVPQVTPAEEVRDIARAIAWLHDHAAEFGGDPSRIFIMGHSAGAHLVALVSTAAEPLQEVGLDLGAVAGTIVLDTGTLDLVAHMERVGRAGLFRDAFGEDPAFWRQMSPLAQIEPDSGIPPFLLLIQGAQTRLDGARRFADALRAAGTEAEVVYLPDHNHGSVNRNVGLIGDWTTKAITGFVTANGAAPANAVPRKDAQQAAQ